MIRTRRASWWSQGSLIEESEKICSIDPYEILRKETRMHNTKHTFFPSSETTRIRIKNFSKKTINQDSKFKLLWDSLIVLLTIFISFSIPYSLSFFQDFSIEIYYCTSAAFSFDILLSFNTSYYQESDLIQIRWKIALNYIKTDFFIDLISAFPFEGFIQQSLGQNIRGPRFFHDFSEFLRCFLLLKLGKLHKIPKLIYQIQLHYSQTWVFSSVKIFHYFLIASIPAHWMTCLFNVLYCFSLEKDYIYWDTLIENDLNRYLKLMERVIQTMTSVGYGDFVTKTSYERIVSIIFMSFTSGVLGYFVGAIHETIEKTSAVALYFRKLMHDFSIFTQKHSIPRKLRMRVMHYLRYLKFSYNRNMFKEEDIIDLLSIPLKEQVFLYTRGFVLIHVPQLRDFSNTCIKALGYSLIRNFYAPGDLVFRQDEATQDLYFITEGNIHINHESTNTDFAKLKKGQFFGEIAFFTDRNRTASAISKNYSEVYSLSRYKFDKIIKNMPKDFETFLTLKRNLKTYGLTYMRTICYLCKFVGHVAKDCTVYNCRADMEEISKKYRKRKDEGSFYKFDRLGNETNNIPKYSLIHTKGKAFEPKESYTGRRYLSQKVMQYNNSLISFRSENNRILSLIHEMGGDDKREGSDSDDSEKNFFNFSLTRRDKQASITRFPFTLQTSMM